MVGFMILMVDWLISCVASVCSWLLSFSMLVVAKVKFPLLVVVMVVVQMLVVDKLIFKCWWLQ